MIDEWNLDPKKAPNPYEEPEEGEHSIWLRFQLKFN